jgi:hypothetical protein
MEQYIDYNAEILQLNAWDFEDAQNILNTSTNETNN